jgi:addiction module HigA family antidote
MTQNRLNPVHPGEVLLEEFLKPMGLSREQLASDIGVTAIQLDKIIAEKDRINADIALRLARYFGTSPRFWMGLQADYDLDMASEFLGNRLEQEVNPRAVAAG